MNAEKPSGSWPFNPARLFQKRLMRDIVLALVITAALPVAVTGLLSDHVVEQRLAADIPRRLHLVAELKRAELQAYIDSQCSDADRQGRSDAIVHLFKALKRRWAAARTPLREFVDSPAWATLAAAHGDAIRLHAELRGYSDLLLIDNEGNVLFSLSRGPTLATNLQAPAAAGSGLSNAFRRAMENAAPRFAGFVPDPMAAGHRSALVTASIDDGDGPDGVLAVRLSAAAITRVLDGAPELTDGVRAYLLDGDRHLLAGNPVLPSPSGPDIIIDTRIARRWQNHPEVDTPGAPLTDRGVDGRPVIGTHLPVLPGAGQRLGLIVEMDGSTTGGAAARLRGTLLAIAITAVAAALVLAAAFVCRLRRPLRALQCQVRELAEKERALTRSLTACQSDLAAGRRELAVQHQAFQQAESSLQFKTLELEAANAQMKKNAADLEAHMATLEQQQLDMRAKNDELEKTHRELAQKARQMEDSSRYKTQFMANMSHELRTPLNSILLLARLLRENKERTLTERQAEFARTIHAAGEDLSTLINDVLDLAKVEAGKTEVVYRTVAVSDVADAMLTAFIPLAGQNGIDFSVHVAPEVPAHLVTDRKRLEQIIKNFLSNAFKFTAAGSIRLDIALDENAAGNTDTADAAEWRQLIISVADTGVGIPADKHAMVFEAFQQVDGSIRRKYGGTGLGLSISRELARLLGGEITLESRPGQGSRFSLHLPVAHRTPSDDDIIRCSPAAAGQASKSDNCRLEETVPEAPQRSILVIGATGDGTDLIAAQARRSGFGLLTADRFLTGLHLADYHQPAAVFVNVALNGADAWSRVTRIKAYAATRHLPVFGIAAQGSPLTAARHLAAGYLRLPLDARQIEAAFARIADCQSVESRTLLVVDADPDSCRRVTGAIGRRPFHLFCAPDAAEAQTILETRQVNAVILNPRINAADRYALLAGLQHDPIPVILFADTPLGPMYHDTAAQFEETLNLDLADTADHLLRAVTARLHLPPDALDDAQRERLAAMDHRQPVLKGRRILLVDDDMRTVFAVSSVLEDHGAEVLTGKSGKESLDKLDGFPEIDLILMDVMIVDADGYQAIREIRRRDRFKTLPIIALTAKAMQGDRSQCVAAGADDYLAKPVDPEKLTSMLTIWLDPRLTDARSAGR